MKFLDFGNDESNLSPEQRIALLAAGTSWIVSQVGLLGWSVYALIRQGVLGPQFILLSISLAVYFVVLIVLRMREPSRPG